jgi:hypothetical protein
MLIIRSNNHGIYPSEFRWNRRGLLFITKKWIVASGQYGFCWR